MREQCPWGRDLQFHQRTHTPSDRRTLKMSLKTLRFLPLLLLAASLSLHAASKPKPAAPAPASADPYTEVQPATETLDLAMYQRIRDEGLNHSHVMEFATALMDGIGPRLTGSPNLAKANAWT